MPVAAAIATSFDTIQQVLPGAARDITVTRPRREYDATTQTATDTGQTFTTRAIFGNHETIQGQFAGVQTDREPAVDVDIALAYIQASQSLFVPKRGDNVMEAAGVRYTCARVITDGANLVHELHLRVVA